MAEYTPVHYQSNNLRVRKSGRLGQWAEAGSGSDHLMGGVQTGIPAAVPKPGPDERYLINFYPLPWRLIVILKPLAVLFWVTHCRHLVDFEVLP